MRIIFEGKEEYWVYLNLFFGNCIIKTSDDLNGSGKEELISNVSPFLNTIEFYINSLGETFTINYWIYRDDKTEVSRDEEINTDEDKSDIDGELANEMTDLNSM